MSDVERPLAGKLKIRTPGAVPAAFACLCALHAAAARSMRAPDATRLRSHAMWRCGESRESVWCRWHRDSACTLVAAVTRWRITGGDWAIDRSRTKRGQRPLHELTARTERSRGNNAAKFQVTHDVDSLRRDVCGVDAVHDWERCEFGILRVGCRSCRRLAHCRRTHSLDKKYMRMATAVQSRKDTALRFGTEPWPLTAARAQHGGCREPANSTVLPSRIWFCHAMVEITPEMKRAGHLVRSFNLGRIKGKTAAAPGATWITIFRPDSPVRPWKTDADGKRVGAGRIGHEAGTA